MISSLDSVPLIMVCPDTPDHEPMETWGINAYLPYPLDLRKLVPILQPWLNGKPDFVSPFLPSQHVEFDATA
ncbi:MAG: hypothetical protein M1546_08735 [Chloroflexi bacterium]|nr:hypothetical protein [Chloroflexota bacterium]